jgi:hypothetical protein
MKLLRIPALLILAALLAIPLLSGTARAEEEFEQSSVYTYGGACAGVVWLVCRTTGWMSDYRPDGAIILYRKGEWTGSLPGIRFIGSQHSLRGPVLQLFKVEF